MKGLKFSYRFDKLRNIEVGDLAVCCMWTPAHLRNIPLELLLNDVSGGLEEWLRNHPEVWEKTGKSDERMPCRLMEIRYQLPERVLRYLIYEFFKSFGYKGPIPEQLMGVYWFKCDRVNVDFTTIRRPNKYKDGEQVRIIWGGS